MNIQLLNKAYNALVHKGPLSCSELGWILWGNSTNTPHRGVGVHKNNKFCRPAGKILKILSSQNRVMPINCQNKQLWRAISSQTGAETKDLESVCSNILFTND